MITLRSWALAWVGFVTAVFALTGPLSAWDDKPNAADPAAGAPQKSHASKARPIVFNRDVRPILSENCFFCHGPDPKTREADLRLDTLEGSRADLGGYVAINPGDLKTSEVWARVTSNDPDTKMPPPDSRKQLTAKEIDILRRWIDQGAEYQEHWSFMPLASPPLPQPKDSAWARNAIDLFIRDAQERAADERADVGARQVQPSPPADPVTLVRRVSFDLTGMPPTPGEVQRFLSDERPGAYERLVDRLLASPRFGERLAIYWLDLVRYADTVGYHGDQDHNAAMYREYVIRAFNAAKTFDQFTIEQLAGDLLPSPTDSQLAASGYNRLLQTTHEGGAQDKEYLAKYAADRVRNVSAVWMGGTLGCAECHDHKYDPYTQKDFYSMAAFFADLVEQGAYSAPNSLPTSRAPEKPLLSEPDQRAMAAIESELAELKSQQQDDRVKARIDELSEAKKTLTSRALKQMISQSREPRTMRILNRGDWMDNSGEVVQPQVPDFLPPLALDDDDSTTTKSDRRATRRTAGGHPRPHDGGQY